MRRRYNPYSRRSEIDASRQAFWNIIALVLAAGLLINLSSNWLTTLLERYVIRGNARTEVVVYGLLLITLLVILGLFAFIYHSRAETDKCRMEIAVPYCFSREDGLQVKEQHFFRPSYEAATKARQLFARAYRSNPQELKKLAADWLNTPRPRRVQPYLAVIHPDLIDSLILQALHDYAKKSLDEEARYDWYAVNIEPKRWAFADLPLRLRQNRYIAAQQGDAKEWALSLPKGIAFTVEPNQYGWLWRFHHTRYGEVQLQCFAPPWARAKGQVVEVFSETYSPKGGKQPPVCDELWVVGTRVLATASFSRTVFPGIDEFHQWATRLLTFLEEALDWGYFLGNRPNRVINDLPWKIGDMPTKNDSLWQKMDAIEKRLDQLEKKG